MTVVMYQSYVEGQKQQQKVQVDQILESLVELLKRYENGDQRKEIEKDLDSLKKYF